MNHFNAKTGYSRFRTLFGAFSILLLLTSVSTFAQNSITGTVVSDSGAPVPYTQVYNETTSTTYTTDAEGQFKITATTPQDLAFYKEGYALLEQTLSPSAGSATIILQKIINLNEVVIQQEKFFSLNRMKDIDGTAIYAGRKTEVISIDKLTANKATNNTRQVYAQVAGLTINENSDGGLQLSIGGRGLNPNRTANFNTRQNGYDISADVLGYPESYYTPPVEGLEEIQVIRGAAAMQYGTQFGGLINFKMRSPAAKPMEIVSRTTVGSYDLFTNFTSLSGTKGKFSYYTYFNYKQGNSFRPYSGFNSRNFFINMNYRFNDKTSLHLDYTLFDYLAQQPGGLTDKMFHENMFQSNRPRNWFDINWNLFALRLNHKFTERAQFSLQLFGLDASRKALGILTKAAGIPDDGASPRNLLTGDFVNWGAEARFLQQYTLKGNTSALLVGMKYYQARNTAAQGAGSDGSGPDFKSYRDEFPSYQNQFDRTYPNLNFAFFTENMFRLSPTFTLTPGMRIEKIRTQAKGASRKINLDGAGNVILDETINEDIVKDRNLILFALGASYKPSAGIEYYGNLSQNYRSITFSDIAVYNPSLTIDPNIKDEKGFTSDIGIRGKIQDKFSFDASAFGLLYNDKIGEYYVQGTDKRNRANIGKAITYGAEALLDWNIGRTFFENNSFSWNVFTNSSVTGSKYLKSKVAGVKGNEVEFVPLLNLKAGTGFGYKDFACSLQVTHLSSQFSDATNDPGSDLDDTSGVYGKIPSYYVADFSASYKWKMLKLEAGVNNFTNNYYFTRRATGYPGPGIIPSDPRTFYTTLQFNF